MRAAPPPVTPGPALAPLFLPPLLLSFMKLRLDRVMKLELAGLSADEALAAGAPLPEFPRPAKWTAPYPAYTPGWWKAFYPPGAQ